MEATGVPSPRQGQTLIFREVFAPVRTDTHQTSAASVGSA
jgi:hypothetical protein